MSPCLPRTPLSILTVLFLHVAVPLAGSPAFGRAHDDDPKVLDRRPPFVGAGYRPGRHMQPGMSVSGDFMLGEEPVVLFPADGVQLLSWVTLQDFGMTGGNDCWGYVAPSGREYAIMGLSGGTGFVEITDPSDPVIVAVIPGPSSLWRDIKTYGTRAFAVSEGGDGIQVIDLSQIDSGIVNLTNTVTSGGTTASHNVAIDEDSGYLYRLGGSNRGLRAYSLNNPNNPSYQGQWNSRYVHDAQVVTYTQGPWAGKQIAFCCSGFNGGFSDPGLSILDVTNKNNITQISQLSYTSPHYSHQAWLSPDRQYLYLNDELDENGSTVPTRTFVFDVSDLENPSEVGWFTNGNRAIGHNLYTKDDRIFEANYRSGMRVFDAADPVNPVEVAHFDTWPGDDFNSYNGLWSVYPYFPSGVVIGSDLEKGLFVWWVGEPLLVFDYPSGRPELFSPDGGSFEVQISEASPGDLQPGTARLHYDAGAGLVEVPLTARGGELFDFSHGALACSEEVAWFVSGRSTNGVLWTDPPQAPYVMHRAWVGHAAQEHFADDMETNTGWSVGSVDDDATEGLWVRGDPTQTESQPEDDHSSAGTRCWFTGPGNTDVDNGQTTLTSPLFDLSNAPDPVLSYWRWFSRHAGVPGAQDRMVVDISNDDGASWVNLEQVTGSGGSSIGAWIHRAFRVADFVTPTDEVRLRFIALDVPIDSEIEAAIDDLRVFSLACDCAIGTYCSTLPNSSGSPASMSWSGSQSVSENDLELVASSVPAGQNGLFIYSADQDQVPLGNGNLCLGTQTLGFILRLTPTTSTPGEQMMHALDVTAPPAPGGLITAGSTWSFQAWFRDVDGAGFNFSDGLEVTFCP